jgi:hypothetical protein
MVLLPEMIPQRLIEYQPSALLYMTQVGFLVLPQFPRCAPEKMVA